MENLIYLEEYNKEKDTNPLAGVTYGPKELYTYLVKKVQNEEGKINVHDLIVYLAGMAGYACQAAALERDIIINQKSMNENFRIVMTGNGIKFLFGESILEYLYGTKRSVWNMVAELLKKLNPDMNLPDMEAHVKSVVDNVGYSNYKICSEYTIQDLYEMLAPVWKETEDIMKEYCTLPDEWPVVYSMALRKGLVMINGALKPETAAGFTMEIAAFASKLDLGEMLP